jgi:glycosyltransferase involved in cell wall biosynthesis
MRQNHNSAQRSSSSANVHSTDGPHDNLQITIAICTWNRAELLHQALSSLTAVIVPEALSWEVLVVDNNSTDTTRWVTSTFEHRLPLRYAFEARPGLSNARNRAIEESRGQYVAFIDDDVQLPREWLASFYRAIGQFPNAAGFGGPVDPWWVRQPDPALARAFLRLRIGFCGVDHGQPEGPLPAHLFFVGANMAFNRAKIGVLRFDPQLDRCAGIEKSDGDNEFVRQLRSSGETVIWVPDMRLLHYVDPRRMSLSYLCKITEGDGRTAARLEAEQLPVVPRIFGVPRWALRRCFELRLKAVRYRIARRRAESLDMLREHYFLRGIISETWAIERERRRQAATGSA